MTRALFAVGLPLLCAPFSAQADLKASLRGYFNFETDLSDSSGNNVAAFRVSGAANPPAVPAWPLGLDNANPSGPGFGGNPAFNGGDGLSNRGTLLAGKSLNLVDARNEGVVIPLGIADLGPNFTISEWQYLSPGATNTASGSRFFAFEGTNNFDVSWGTPALGVGPYPSAAFVAYNAQVAQTPNYTLSSFGWHHVVHSFATTGGNTTLSIYLDGVFQQTGPTQPFANMDFTAIVIGRQRTIDGGDRNWDGMLDEFGFWTRSLEQSDVTELYQLGVSGQSVVPEPASAGLMALAGGWLLVRRRRQSRV